MHRFPIVPTFEFIVNQCIQRSNAGAKNRKSQQVFGFSQEEKDSGELLFEIRSYAVV